VPRFERTAMGGAGLTTAVPPDTSRGPAHRTDSNQHRLYPTTLRALVRPVQQKGRIETYREDYCQLEHSSLYFLGLLEMQYVSLPSGGTSLPLPRNALIRWLCTGGTTHPANQHNLRQRQCASESASVG
jgi:hypothetical protein